MKKRLISIFFLLFLCSSAYSQVNYGEHILGPSIGFWVKGSSPIIGFNYEYELPQAGIGNIGVGGIARYWTFNETHTKIDSVNKKYTFTVKYTNIFLGGQINYNFNMIGDGRFVPYGGLVLGFNNVNDKYTADSVGVPHVLKSYDKAYVNGLLIWVQGGFRYFFTPRLAGTVRLGLGNIDFSTIELGLDFKLN